MRLDFKNAYISIFIMQVLFELNSKTKYPTIKIMVFMIYYGRNINVV